MKARDYRERKQLRAERRKSSYTSARLSRATMAALRELLREIPLLRGVDELVYELAAAELARRNVKPAVIATELARVGR